jgi:uncharacterized alkaline shock family protein YloU
MYKVHKIRKSKPRGLIGAALRGEGPAREPYGSLFDLYRDLYRVDMFYEKSTPNGVITLDKGLVGSIIKREVSRLDGKVLLSGPKSKFYKNAAMDKLGDDAAFFDIGAAADGPSLRIYIVIKLGASISGISEQLIEAVRGSIFEITGINASVSIIVKGVLSKNLSKREIEVNGR